MACVGSLRTFGAPAPLTLGVRRLMVERQNQRHSAMNKHRDDSGLWTIHGIVELAVRLGFISGAAVSAALGQVLLAVILMAVALGVFLRFKRRKATK